MDIYEAEETEQKSYLLSLMRRYEAIASHFGLVSSQASQGEPLAPYVKDVAELVEMSRMAQVIVENLIELEECDVDRYITDKSLYIPPIDVEEKSVEQIRSDFLCLMHQCGGQAYSLRHSIVDNIKPASVRDERVDSSEHYAYYRRALAELQDRSLLAQVVLAHLIRIDNYNRFRSS